MALPSAVVEVGVNKMVSYISTKLDDKALTADTIARLEIALSRLDIVLEKTGKIAITDISLLRSWKFLKREHMEGIDMLNKYKPQELDGLVETGQAVVRSPSYLQWIANRAANLSISSLVGLSKEPLSSSVAKTVERYADWAEKFAAEVESSCPLRRDTSRYPFLRHLFEGKTLGCEKMVKKRRQSLGFYLHPVIVEGRGVEVRLFYDYFDCRMPKKCFYLWMTLRISEDTDIIRIIINCMQWFKSQFKLAVESAIGELTLLPNLQDSFRFVSLPSFMKDDRHVFYSKLFCPDPICCNGNSYGNLANKLSNEIPEQIVDTYFCCNISAPKNKLRNASPLILSGLFAPHLPCGFNGKIFIEYGGKEESRNGSVQQLEEIARSDGINYLVHEAEPTDYALFWTSPHGGALVILEQSMPTPSRRVSKRKR